MKIQVCLIALAVLLSEGSRAESPVSGVSQPSGAPRLFKRSLFPAVRIRYQPPQRIFVGYQTVLPLGYPVRTFLGYPSYVAPPAHLPTLNLHLQPPYPPAPGLSVLPPYPVVFFR